MVSNFYKTLRSALSSRYPVLTLTYHRERKSLAARGDLEPQGFLISPDCRRHSDKMALARTETIQKTLVLKTADSPALSDADLPLVTLCLVTYNSARWVNGWATAIAALDYPRDKIRLSLVDNGSTDATVVQMKAALSRQGLLDRIVSNVEQHNLGFGAGQNCAVRNAKTDYVLVINPDAAPAPQSLRIAVNFALNDAADVCAWEFAQTPYEHPKYYDPVTLETSWNSHACVLIKRAAFLAVKGYEPALFLYGEDVELSYRFRANGFRLRCLPKARITHNIMEETRISAQQEIRCIAANLCLRRRYGCYWDRLIGYVIIARCLARRSQNNGAVETKERVKAAFKLYLSLKPSFPPNRPKSVFFPFSGIDYDRRRLGTTTLLPSLLSHDPNSATPAPAPRVSIITRVHRPTPLLFEALACVRNQTYPNIEHIVVFDGCDPVSYPGIIPLIHNGRGRSSAANMGAEKASGDYILFFDYDDLLFADHIEGLVHSLRAAPDAVAAYAYAWEAATFDRDVGSMRHLGLQNKMETQFSPEGLTQTNYFAIQSILMKRMAFERIGGFNTDIEYCEDWDLWQRLLNLGPFTPYPKLTSIYFTPASLRTRITRAWQMSAGAQ